MVIDQKIGKQVLLVCHWGEIDNFDPSCFQDVHLTVQVAHVVDDREQVQIGSWIAILRLSAVTAESLIHYLRVVLDRSAHTKQLTLSSAVWLSDTLNDNRLSAERHYWIALSALIVHVLHQRVLHLDHGAEHETKFQLEQMWVLKQLFSSFWLSQTINEQVKFSKVLLDVIDLHQLFQQLVFVFFLRQLLGITSVVTTRFFWVLSIGVTCSRLFVFLWLTKVLKFIQSLKDGELSRKLGSGTICNMLHESVHLRKERIVGVLGHPIVQLEILQSECRVANLVL